MARKPRLHIPGGLYHVMLRGNGGQDIFIDDEDRLSPVFTDPARDGTSAKLAEPLTAVLFHGH